MIAKTSARALMAAMALVVLGPSVARGAEANLRHISITTSSPLEAARWYVRHMKCEAIPERRDAVRCGSVDLVFVVQPTMGGTQGTGINHLGFSFADLTAKMAELEKVGVQGTGVRLQRFEDGSTVRDVPGLFKIAFIFDPWGTRIELVQDPERLGLHHVHLSATNPNTTLAWYRDALGGKPAELKGKLEGVAFGNVLLLVSRHGAGTPATSEGRAIDHLAFVVKDLNAASRDLRQRKVRFVEEPTGNDAATKRALVSGPDNVRLVVVEPGFKGKIGETAAAAILDANAKSDYVTPRTPWGEPNLQGLWTGNTAHGIPLERPANAEGEALTAEEAEARRERGTLGSIWGYEREWRDTTLGIGKARVSNQVAMVVDPPDGRIPPLTEEGRRRAEANRRQAATEETGDGFERLPEGPEDLSPYVRCITRGLPGNMMPSVYNNGLQIVQGPGFVTIQNEMIHETRVIPTKPRERVGSKLTSWLGESLGRWEGDSLVVETTNFNGRAGFRGSSASMKLTERWTRVGDDLLEYRFTVEDPTIWTKSWTGQFHFDLGADQYELVEYSCHEGNYGMTNILSGARAKEREREAPKAVKE